MSRFAFADREAFADAAEFFIEFGASVRNFRFEFLLALLQTLKAFFGR